MQAIRAGTSTLRLHLQLCMLTTTGRAEAAWPPTPHPYTAMCHGPNAPAFHLCMLQQHRGLLLHQVRGSCGPLSS
jgi:hypothetical protein